MYRLFKQRKAKLANGDTVKFGDTVTFTNSDGENCTSTIKRRRDGTLYYWNPLFEIKDYDSARKIK